MEPMSTKTKLLFASGILALLAGGVLLGRTAFAPTVAPAAEEHAEEEGHHGPAGFVAMDDTRAKAAGIVVETVTVGGLGAEIIAQGAVAAAPDGEAVLTARADGAIVRMTKHLGDAVRAGETIAYLESRDAASIAAERSAARARVTQARSAYAREKKLFDAKVTARQDLEAAEALLAEAEAEASRAQSAANAAKVSGDGRHLAVTSLISGRITTSNATLGSYVTAGSELFRVSDPSKIQVNASLLPHEARRIRPGDSAVIELIGGETVAARVRSLTPGLDPQSKAATVVLTPASPAQLTPGQGLRVRIKPQEAAVANAIGVSEEAVQSVEGRDVVFVKTAEGFQAKSVTVGQRSSGRVEIVGGLKPGSIIATGGAFLLKAELGKGEAGH